ncbi:dal80p-controlled protein [Friedmanniomyces endolithicus]|uniref:Dal80p-controlled protein n=1 Tax=Friedmanniomyces endolithicus TaxID=329885 RepID=A0AAN6FLC3_9PEZI|nr:dal80p-controlled protein [Friedmanniomyces endolithicus]KAK0282643.1 dal80p-controlled protein [Friedmanniomyces endolithicus]KAK0319217.1 dal80p-controlled protein [Friedmanniomyces endolithicus]KAK0987463.1 Protein dcg1 [Friedmanniomyces endolithicus]
MSDSGPRSGRSILIINPNTTVAMTDALRPLVDSLGYNTASDTTLIDLTRFTYFTAPAGVPSINNESDAAVSARICLSTLESKLQDHDAFLVCCYSKHPLVPLLRAELAKLGLDHKPVTGIFEASVAACLQSINPQDIFGIVSTGSQWEAILGIAVAALLGSSQSSRYAGTETTGLNADELHSAPKREVDLRIKFATKALLEKGARAICLGCVWLVWIGRCGKRV